MCSSDEQEDTTRRWVKKDNTDGPSDRDDGCMTDEAWTDGWIDG